MVHAGTSTPRRLIGYMRPYWGRFALSLAAGFLASVLDGFTVVMLIPLLKQLFGTAGLFMPSRPLIGARFYQEIAPAVAMDRVEIISDTESLKTPAGEFHDCVKTEETTPRRRPRPCRGGRVCRWL